MEDEDYSLKLSFKGFGTLIGWNIPDEDGNPHSRMIPGRLSQIRMVVIRYTAGQA